LSPSTGNVFHAVHFLVIYTFFGGEVIALSYGLDG